MMYNKMYLNFPKKEKKKKSKKEQNRGIEAQDRTVLKRVAQAVLWE